MTAADVTDLGNSAAIEALYCGCCGNEIGQSTRSDPEWCARCRSHVLPYRWEITGCRSPAWTLTWFAQTGQDCPHQIAVLDAPEAQEADRGA